MIKYVAAGMAALSLAGCATGGSGNAGGGTSAGTQFASPKEFSPEEFNKNQEKYAKTWTKYLGGGVDSYKKIAIPTYTLEVQTSMYKVGKNKIAAVLANSDGARSTLTLAINLPIEKHEALMTEIAGISYNRLKDKFKKTGVQVVEWSEVLAASKKAAEYEKDNFTSTPIEKNEHFASFVAPGAFRKHGFSPYQVSALSRDAEIALFFPNFGIGYGYFDGATTPHTIAEAHGMAGVYFTPQVQVFMGSGVTYQSKWNAGGISLDYSAVSNTPFVTKLDKTADSRADASSAEENRRRLASAWTGAASHEVKVSSAASTVYNIQIDEMKFKEAVLKELDAAEDLIVTRYKSEL